jgi:hypothetical protein
MAAKAALCLLAIVPALLADSAGAEGFSIDEASPSAPPALNSAILSAGPAGGPPVVEEMASSLALSGGAVDDANGMTFGSGAPWKVLHFSVDRNSIGASGAVAAEAAAGQAAGDLFASDLGGSNYLVFNQRELGLVPNAAAGASTIPPVDDVDAFDFGYHPAAAELMTYTLANGHALVGTAAGCGGDVFFVGDLWWPYSQMGLISCQDDIDAIEVDSVDTVIYYSLAPGSPSLAPGSRIVGCSSGCSPADIFKLQTIGDPPISVVTIQATAADLGLLPTDNVDALAFGDPVPQLPVLGGVATLALLGTLLGVGRTESNRCGRAVRAQARRSRSGAHR